MRITLPIRSKGEMETLRHSCAGAVYPGSVLLTAASAPGQNLLVSCVDCDSIVGVTPGGAQITSASELNHPVGLAFDNAGNLFEADSGSSEINEFTFGAQFPIGPETQPRIPSGASSPRRWMSRLRGPSNLCRNRRLWVC